jgi:hypothetical protein
VTLRAVIAARIDRPGEGARLVLQQAVVLGSVFDLAVLRALTVQGTALEAALARLESAYAISADPHRSGWFTFRHPLVREVAYQTLSLAQRRALHAAAAAALQQLGPPSERLGELLYHLERGEQWGQAAATARRAAEAARRLGPSGRPPWQPVRRLRDFTTSAVHLRRSAERWEQLGDLANLAGICINLRVVEQAADDYPAAAVSLERARALFEQVGDQRGVVRALARLGVLAGTRGDPQARIQRLEQALALVEGIGARERHPEYYR